MLIGVPKEIKVHEYRVGLTPESVSELVHHGHEVVVEHAAGAGIGADDGEYERAGARVVADAAAVFEIAELIVKVKEPQPGERDMLREGQALFTYLHLAPDPQQTAELLERKVIGIAYETVTSASGGLPLLAPMSEVAGRLSVQVGAHCLQRPEGGRGVLLGGVPGVTPATVLILGGGVVGTHAAWIAVGMGAHVIVVDRNPAVLDRLWSQFDNRVETAHASRTALQELVPRADLLIGGVLIKGAAAPKLVDAELVARMREGSVVVDVAIDQGGCIETSRPTTHAEPTFVHSGVVHYCVTNMPGAVPRTSTYALNNATLPFVLALADKGVRQALLDDAHLREGLNVYQGSVTCPEVAAALGHRHLERLQALRG
ncbi:MAG: alanine dehydrogenase [Gammaproteobacteria bacterium]|nr:alanine dehydrogenase [Gammaproteobacteria bacterium]